MASVTLSCGTTVKVGPLKWQAYKTLKAKVIDLLSDRVVKLFATGSVDNDFIASLIRELPVVLDSLNEEFIAGCIDRPGVLQNDSLDVSDLDALYAAALEVNPMEGILTREKNSPAGELAAKLIALAPAGAMKKLPAAGGSTSSLNVFDPAGDPAS